MYAPYEAQTDYHLGAEFHRVIDERYPNSAGNRKTYETRADAEIAAMRLNAKWLNEQADLREIRRSTEIGRMHDELTRSVPSGEGLPRGKSSGPGTWTHPSWTQ